MGDFSREKMGGGCFFLKKTKVVFLLRNNINLMLVRYVVFFVHGEIGWWIYAAGCADKGWLPSSNAVQVGATAQLVLYTSYKGCQLVLTDSESFFVVDFSSHFVVDCLSMFGETFRFEYSNKSKTSETHRTQTSEHIPAELGAFASASCR